VESKPRKLLTINEVLELLNVSRNTFDRWVKDGVLKVLRLPVATGSVRGPIRVDQREIDRILAEAEADGKD
jgi:excisionase family DNA binding protein